jgi:alpha-1,2-mannosyltransferase
MTRVSGMFVAVVGAILLSGGVVALFGGFTRDRVRMHAALLAVVIWGTYIADLTRPGLRDWAEQIKGADFVHEYVLGRIALARGTTLLYDFAGQTALARQVIPGLTNETYLPIYGPQVSLLYAPFAALPYLWAAACWQLLSAAIYAACTAAVWRTTPHLQREAKMVALLALSLPGFFQMIAFGQNSALALLALTLAYLALRRARALSAGLALGLLFYKPQFGVAAAVLFVVTGQWRVVLGGALMVAMELAVAAGYYGPACLRDYEGALTRLYESGGYVGSQLYQMCSLRSFWQLLLPWPAVAWSLYALSAVAVLVLLVRAWKSRAPLPLRYAIFVLATVLVDPHLTFYDLVIVAGAFLLVGDDIMGRLARPDPAASSRRQRIQWLLFLSYALPLLGPPAGGLRLQLAVPPMLMLLVVLVKESHVHPGLEPEAA